MIKTYWYCNLHDDVYHVKHGDDFDPNSVYYLKWDTTYCTRDTTCGLEYIGYKRYGESNDIIEDTTPSQNWFNRRNGGFEVAYLNKVDEIFIKEGAHL